MSASQDDFVCHLEGRLSPPAGHPGSREDRTLADADTVLRAWRDAGGAGVSALRGQFSAVVWDRGRTRLQLVCDRLARQGWYVLERSGEILFATELRDLLRLAPARPDTDSLSFTMWLGGQGCPEGRTLYAGISRLGPGESFAYSGGALDRHVHWRPTFQTPQRANRRELAEELRRQLLASTWQYVSPGVTGVILSGGIDSSVVAATAAEGQAAGIDVRTYSAVFPGAPYDESAKIRALTGALGVRAQAIQPAPAGALWLALRHLEEWAVPLVAPGALLEMSVVASAAADGADIVLDGQTGDEVLGFAPFLLADRLAHGRLLAARRLLRSWPVGRTTSRRERVRLLRMFGVKGAAPYRFGRVVRDRRNRTEHGPKWLVPARRQAFLEFEDAWSWKRTNAGPRWWRSFTDTVVWGPHRELRLEYLRHRAASAGIRWGSPLYDEGLVDFCSRLDPEIAFDPRVNRPLVREALSDLLPDVVRLQTRKANFSAFAVETMQADTAGLERLLGAPDAEIAAYVDLGWLRQRWRVGEPLPGPMSPFWGGLWRAAMGQAWLQFGADPAGIADLAGDPAIRPPQADAAELAPR
jgi:asparagine synthetase B (glutamine-hydrolysing)